MFSYLVHGYVMTVTYARSIAVIIKNPRNSSHSEKNRMKPVTGAEGTSTQKI